MKWVTFISCLFLVSVAETEHLLRRYWDVGLHSTISCFTESTEKIDYLSIATFSQFVQQATYEEIKVLVDFMTAFLNNCSSPEQQDPRCQQPLTTKHYQDEFCHEQGIANKYGYADCCAKIDPERNECILSHKNATPGFIPPFQKPDPEEICKQHKGVVVAQGIYETARRYPYTSVLTILTAGDEFGKLLTTCCQEANKNTCFNEKESAINQKFYEDRFLQQYTCLILKKDGSQTLRALKIAQLSQKFPRNDRATIFKLAEDITHAYEDCCQSNALECFQKTKPLNAYFCNLIHNISTEANERCTGHSNEECISIKENGERTADLSPTLSEFVDHKGACQHYVENQTSHLGKFLYEYSRRHPEHSAQLILRLVKEYKDLLDQCCTTENAEVCVAQLEEQINKHIADNLEVIKPYCDSAKQGDYVFQNVQLLVYTKRAPQLSFDDLYKYTKQLADVGAKCCPLNDTKLLACVDESVDFVLGAMCLQQEHQPINEQVSRCCSGPYPFRRLCFLSLGVDEKYTPVPFSPELHEDLCPDYPEELKRQKERPFGLPSKTRADWPMAVYPTLFDIKAAQLISAYDSSSLQQPYDSDLLHTS